MHLFYLVDQYFYYHLSRYHFCLFNIVFVLFYLFFLYFYLHVLFVFCIIKFKQGWALYAESLGEEMDVFDDDYEL